MKSRYYITFLIKIIPLLFITSIVIVLAIPYLVTTDEFKRVIKEYIRDIKMLKYSYFTKHYRIMDI
jgi:hypothetical protein